MISERRPKMLVLPQKCSAEAQICTLAHPRTKIPTRYLFDPEKGVHEFTRVAPPKVECKSWLIEYSHRDPEGQASMVKAAEPVENDDGNASQEGLRRTRGLRDGHIISKPDLLVATPIDPLFLLVPAFSGQFLTSEDSKRLFLSFDDLIDKLTDASKIYEQLMKHELIRKTFEARMQAMCDWVDAADEKMYRLNMKKLMNELYGKASKIQESGLPQSMEDKFIRRALDLPVVGIKREESTMSEKQSSQTETQNPETPSLDTQASTETFASSESVNTVETDITAPDIEASVTDAELQRLLRVRTVISYMILSYIPLEFAASLTTMMTSDESPIDFKPLNARLEHVAKTHAEALAARSLGNFSRKRNAYEDDDAAEARAEKKRKKEEEDKKKKLETRGLRDLKKVDTKGMKKMSDFFGKGAATKKK